MVQIPVRGIAPSGSHAKPGCARILGGLRRLQHFVDGEQALAFQLRIVLCALRTIAAVLWASPCLDAEQRAHLNLVGIEVGAVHGLGAEKQIVEGLIEERDDFVDGPIVAGLG
jgi:hypothetical protein